MEEIKDQGVTIETPSEPQAPSAPTPEVPVASTPTPELPTTPTPVPEYTEIPGPGAKTADEPEFPRGKAITSMVLGIVSIVLGLNAGFPGIILASIASKMANALLAQFPNASSIGFAKAGRITSKVGLIVSIISTVMIAIVIFYYILMCVLVIAGVLSPEYLPDFNFSFKFGV